MRPELLSRASALLERPGRSVLGITGPPGAGKSALAGWLVTQLGSGAALLPMDGFHLADNELERLGRAGRKGAPDTFDAAGFVALLHRVRRETDDVVYAPAFRRELELAEAGALAVGPEVALVVVEGNYLLLGGPFAPVQALLDESWFVEVDPTTVTSGSSPGTSATGGPRSRHAPGWTGSTSPTRAWSTAPVSSPTSSSPCPDRRRCREEKTYDWRRYTDVTRRCSKRLVAFACDEAGQGGITALAQRQGPFHAA